MAQAARKPAADPRVTIYVALPFGRTEEGDLVPLQAVEARDSHGARRRAAQLAAEHGGAIAFSRTGDAAMGDWDDAVILETFGEVAEGALGE